MAVSFNLSNYEDLYKLASELGCIVLKDELLSKHTTFKIGGPADLFIKVFNIDSLKSILNYIKENNIPFFSVGNGSNLLVSDLGFRGVVLKLGGDFNNIELVSDNKIMCGCGASLAKACVFSLQHSLSGLEFAWGIPGSCGGAMFMNAGAYNKDMALLLEESTHITPTGIIQTIPYNKMNLSYRKSIYSDKNYIITSILLHLAPGNQPDIRKKMYNNIAKRKLKQPLDYPNCGSVFKRPGNGLYAGSLIEQCGLKGRSIGGAAVSPKHAGFIINTGNATYKDVIKLINFIKDEVYKSFNILLECEVRIIGETQI